ncbi:monocarboxylate transporter 9-like [Mytilus edulis]|uniref:monocarboxylate transporter 9-like n=1 Tax=Mytilus edulis TaxID=6550 RepID=UPI0039EF5658
MKKWMVLIMAFMSVVMSTGFPFNMSVLYVEWLDEFKKSNSETALVQSICTGIFSLGGSINGIIVTKFGPCRCGIAGGIVAAAGLAISYFATSIYFLVLSVGIVTGFGLSLSFISASTSVGLYFDGKQRLMALALVSTGGGVGAAIVPIILDEFIGQYNWRGALLVLGGITTNLIANACLFTKPSFQIRRRKSDVSHGKSTISYVSNNDSLVITENKIQHPLATNATQSSTCASISKSEIRRVHKEADNSERKGIFDILTGLLKNKLFISYIFAQAMCLAAYNSIMIFYIDFFKFKGLTRTDAVSIYFYMNVMSTVFRFVTGLLKQIPHVSVIAIPVFCALLGASSMGLFPLVGSSYIANLLVAFMYGCGRGGMFAVLGISIVKLAGPENYSVALGISMTFSGILNAVAGPVSGLIRDSTGNYDMSFFCSAATAFVACIVFVTIMFIRFFANRPKSSELNFEIVIRQKSWRRSSILPWKKQSVDISK